jgi:hypothetical protein
VPQRQFNTIPEELLDLANVAVMHFQGHGFSVSIEKTDLGFPFTPAFLCKRYRTTMIVEVDSKVQHERIQSWVSYGRSYGRDFRIALCLSDNAVLPNHDEIRLRSLGVGCYVLRGDSIFELLPPSDLALNVILPDLGEMPRKVRELLGSAYEQFDRTQWREGFETACQAFEDEARRYLKRHIRRGKSGRIDIATSKGIANPSHTQINKMTMGQLATTFSRIQIQNKADSDISKTLSAINKDRVSVVHKKNAQTTERRLRENVGRHMWSLVAALKQAIK